MSAHLKYKLARMLGGTVYILSAKVQWDQPRALLTLRCITANEREWGNRRVATLLSLPWRRATA